MDGSIQTEVVEKPASKNSTLRVKQWRQDLTFPAKLLRSSEVWLANRNKEGEKRKKKEMEFLVVSNYEELGSFMIDQKLRCRPIILSERTMERDS